MTIEVVRGTTGDGIPFIDSSGREHQEIAQTLGDVSRQVANWVSQVQGRSNSSLFDRTSYITPDNPYTLMKTARTAVANDDVVSGVCDVTEGLMLQGVKWESEEADDAEIFNQLSRDLNLDEFVRQWHREEFTYSQVVVGMWWGDRDFKMRGKASASGNRRRKTVRAHVPVGLSFLDPQRVVPLQPGPFGNDRIAWHATKGEMQQWGAYQLSGDPSYLDPVMRRFFLGSIFLPRAERDLLQKWGIDATRLIELDPEHVFRYSRTKPTYDRFPENRLKSVFPLLDLKQQLMEADRVSLVGAANYILLIRKGTEKDPAMPEEIDNLNDQFKVVAKLPVIIGDHRLNIDIITPDQEHVLAGEKYDTLDRRILARTLGAITISGGGQRNESTLTVARGIGRLLESRRLMMKRVLEQRIARAAINHPKNDGVFTDEPNLTFTPRNVQLDSDAQIVQAIMALRAQKEISRESTLEFFNFDQATEAQRRQYEEESGLDDIFKTEVPFSGNGGSGETPNGAPEPPAVSGARGGRPKGGGKSKQSPQAQTKPNTGNGNPSTGK